MNLIHKVFYRFFMKIRNFYLKLKCFQSAFIFHRVHATLFRFITQKMKFSIKDFFSKFDQILSFLRIWSHLLKKSLMENFIFCVVNPLFYRRLKFSHTWIMLDHFAVVFTIFRLAVTLRQIIFDLQ